MKRSRFPSGWNEERVRRVLEHYDRQTEDEAVSEDEAAFRRRGLTAVVVPERLVPEVTRLMRWEIPRLCRGGSRSLTDPGISTSCALIVSNGPLTPTPLPLFPLPWGEGRGEKG